MSKQEEPAYRTAYANDGKPICPECGSDLSGQKEANVLAHSEDHYPVYARENFSDEAKERKDILAKIAKELGK